MGNDISTISQAIRAKLDPHLAALAQLTQSELESMRLADMSREEVLLRLQDSIIRNNQMIVKVTEMFVDFRADINTIMSLVASLEASVTTYDEAIEDLKHRLDTLERQ